MTRVNPNGDFNLVGRPDESLNHISILSSAQADRFANRAAIVRGNESISYADLNRRANRWANLLRSLGVDREVVVALCLGRSIESIVCALAVIKAGGAYLPLDPDQPAERLMFMLNDARPRVLIANPELVEQLSQACWTTIDVQTESCADCSADAPRVETNGDDLAYVIYTSGSTGRPKGVEITHASLSNLIGWHQREFNVTGQDRATHLANVSFDAAVWEVWPYLTAGATLYLPDEDTRLSAVALRDWLIANRITISFVPTALAEAVMTLDWPAETSLRFLLTGADTLHRYPTGTLPFVVVNNYGPTECTVVATSGRVDSNASANQLPSIGRPITNTSALILDNEGREVAAGETGELYIGGACLARGYRNRPDLTAEKFIDHPFKSGDKLYRTGDLVRQMPSGELTYVGRIDQQIKILGYRIEPAEIEAAIDRHPAIAASVVLARASDCAEKRLTAYVTMRNCVRPAASELRDFLKTTLPEYMLPSLFVKLEALPLAANGKVDRTALPEPSSENTLRDEAFITPRSPVEQRLAKILCSLLGLSEVSANDDFFLLGGHSLLGTQLIIKIRNSFGVDLSLRTLFDAPTVAELSVEIERLIIARVENMSEEEAQALLA